jgi:hypothetical protein
MTRKKGTTVAKPDVIDIPEDIKIKWKFDALNAELKKAGFELIIRRPVSRDLVVFDYGLMFTRGSKEVQIYVDEDLQQVIEYLLETNEQLVIKSNWLSPDTVAITVPGVSQEMTQNEAGSPQSDDSSENVS